jgi:hypothetical protein
MLKMKKKPESKTNISSPTCLKIVGETVDIPTVPKIPATHSIYQVITETKF